MPRYDGRPAADDPLAYFLTWTTYGTWLPGDERGWVEKPGQFREADPLAQRIGRHRMTEEALLLDDEQRAIVETTIRRHCEIRHWYLHAVSCRTNHVHVVVTARVDPEIIMDQFKASCTRRLKEHAAKARDSAPPRMNWWTQRGSKRHLNDQIGLEGAIWYVLEGQ
jgi:REP element-mobilizing transposase RayT